MKKTLVALGGSLLLAMGMIAAPDAIPAQARLQNIQAQADELPGPLREFRGAWVATVANIDWPSRRDLTVEQQQAEARAILDRAVEMNLNAIIFQIRPSADAFYQSDLEPWSFFLTGEQGRAPEPFYDPLEFWVTESHKRGLELHTWFNPYRAHHSAQGRHPQADNHISQTHPHLVRRLTNGMEWMNPAEPEVKERTIEVFLDVARRYNIDGVHIDDYFYPYASYDENRDFDDEENWQAYLAGGGRMTRSDWRRSHVDSFIREFYTRLKEENPEVRFGISPFGIWRPGFPAGIQGLDQFEALFADARLWLNEGWLDYWTPQLYWPIHQVPQSFSALLTWWTQENHQNRNVWPGVAAFRVEKEPPYRWGPWTELASQIMVARTTPGSSGHIHFSFRAFMGEDNELVAALRRGVYAQQALVPASPWLNDRAPEAPTVTDSGVHPAGGRTITITAAQGTEPFLYVVYRLEGRRWIHEIIPATRTEYIIPGSRVETTITDNVGGGVVTETTTTNPASTVAVSAVSRTGVEGPRRAMLLP